MAPSLSRGEMIKNLNDQVVNKSAKAIAQAKDRGEEVEVDVKVALRKKTVMDAGYPIYEERSGLVVAGLTVLSTYMVLLGFWEFGASTTLINFAVAFLCYDLFSGVLHVVLDEPANINVPLLGQPALEFQWHHRLPHDIASKSFVDVVGDLNVVSFILTVIHYTYSANMGTNAMAIQLTGFKLWMAYFGQFSHRCSHIHKKQAFIPGALQSLGLMISTKNHLSHHTPPHTSDFCLIGILNPVMDAATRITANRYFWLVTFLAMSIFDVKVEEKLCRAVDLWRQ